MTPSTTLPLVAIKILSDLKNIPDPTQIPIIMVSAVIKLYRCFNCPVFEKLDCCLTFWLLTIEDFWFANLWVIEPP